MISAYEEAVRRIAGRTPVAASLNSDEWSSQVPVALREKAFWSSRVSEVRIVEEMRRKLLDAVGLHRPGGAGMNRARWVAEMRTILGASPGDTRKLSDITSFRRLELIHDWHMEDAHEYGAYRMALDPDLYAEFPAYELIRVEERAQHRDWWSRWQNAGSSVGWQGAVSHAMAALVDSPIWTALSRFGRPWPPYDFGSGMGRRKLGLRETQALGLIPPNTTPRPSLAPDDFMVQTEASLRDLDDSSLTALQNAFGERLTIDDDGMARWRMQPRVKQGEPLTEDETKSITDYTDLGYLRTNTALRDWRRMDTYQLANADQLQSGITKLPPYQGTVFRGTDIPPATDERLVPGRIVQFPENLSTSIDPGRVFHGSHHFTILSRNGRQIQALSQFPGEAEVLFPAGSLFRVSARSGNHITLQEI